MIIDKYAIESIFKNAYGSGRAAAAAIPTAWDEQGFRSVFGVWDYEAAFIWNAMDTDDNKKRYDIKGWRPKYLLDALFFMKGYYTERQASIFCNRDEKSLRKWNWAIATAIASQDWVSDCMV